MAGRWANIISDRGFTPCALQAVESPMVQSPAGSSYGLVNERDFAGVKLVNPLRD